MTDLGRDAPYSNAGMFGDIMGGGFNLFTLLINKPMVGFEAVGAVLLMFLCVWAFREGFRRYVLYRMLDGERARAVAEASHKKKREEKIHKTAARLTGTASSLVTHRLGNRNQYY